MAFIEMNFMSESLMRTVTVYAILPADKLLPLAGSETGINSGNIGVS